LQITNSVRIQSSNNFKTQNLSFQTKIKSSFCYGKTRIFEFRAGNFCRYLTADALSLPVGDAESSRPAVLVALKSQHDLNRLVARLLPEIENHAPLHSAQAVARVRPPATASGRLSTGSAVSGSCGSASEST
jgi:hypothetical protein